ncbi:diacylglycerol/lipid kinase family protein [Peptoniphilus mikwangii]|uniref:diacylglycerol/lipid kinase family protein n=1 Tax=Peptoniphilus mikwangii TaxID=1354300 RepID=UPI000408ABDD|nr:YegS/Rv2252/BmrU family lipid kinase [Peptoniphilus mikwangii]
MNKILFILSTKAGSSDFKSFKENIINTYTKHNMLENLKIVETLDKEHAKRAAQEFIELPYENKIIYSCGGDGTLNEVASVVYGSNTALGLIPMGTGNDFSKNFDYSNFKIEQTINPKISPIDIISINDRISVNVMSLGFDTSVLRNVYMILKKYPFFKKHSFMLGAIYSLLNIESDTLNVELNLANGKSLVLNDTYTITALCNGRYYGSGFNPSPNSILDDGILELLLVKKLSLLKILNLLPKYKKGTHLNNKKVAIYEVTSGKICSENEIYANCDGEIFKSKYFNFKVLKNSILWANLK